MANKNNPTGNSGLSANLLPNLYQTPANKKFLQATVDQLFQPGSVNKVSGYIGRENAKASTGADLFAPSADSSRKNYQLEPGLTIKDSFGNVTFFKDYIDYINQIGVFGGNTSNHQRLNAQEFYSWDPKIDWDKFANFQNYYWMSYGPEVVTISGQQLGVISAYTVELQLAGNTSEYLFTPNGLSSNPLLKLYRGQTYTFDINSIGHPFSIKTERSTGEIDLYSTGVDAQGVETGTVTFVVPDNAPNRLFYQSQSDINVGGIIEIYDIDENTFLDVENDILGKKNYTLPSVSGGMPLSNGMLVEFGGNVIPALYATGQFYVEGVGTAIKLVPSSVLEIVSPYTVSEDVAFDALAFDTGPFDGATGYASQFDYITINRASRDRNPWSRYNRWFHKDVINAVAAYNGTVPSLDQNNRAIRPIIEFHADLKLFNLGTHSTHDVDLIDTFTTDVFSTIEGSLGYNVDGVNLASGFKVLFTADTDPLVANKIFRVEFVTIQGRTQIRLVEIGQPSLNEVVIVKRGVKNQSLMYWYDGSAWLKGQQKVDTNQAPLFDVVNNDGISYGDSSVYSGSTFVGTSIFSYKVSETGTPDASLGFPLTYQNVNNIGDIVFNFTLATDTFQYKADNAVVTKRTDIGYLLKQDYAGNVTYENGWQTCNINTVQAGIRIYNDSSVDKFNVDIFDDITDLNDLVVRVYKNGVRVPSSMWTLETTAVYKQVVWVKDSTGAPIFNFGAADILTIKAFAKQPINSNGYYEIPVNLQNNPLNAVMGDFALGEVLDHVNSILDNTPEFVGTFPGAGNLRDLGNVTPHGTKFVQHSGPLSLGIFHITSQSNNIVTAVERSRDDYNNFKRVFLSVAENLGVDAAPEIMVELILQKINANKPKTSPYYFSDMVPYGGKITTNLTVVDSRIKTYPLSNVFTLTELSNKAVGVYLTHDTTTVQLIHGVDYTFDSQGLINVTASLTTGDVITTYEYDNTDGCFVPSTPTKLGLWPKFVPHIYTDTTLLTPRTMIQGHDGSQILAYGDYRDGLILELEKRIFNNIKVDYDTSVFDIADVIPGYNRPTDYSLKEFNEVLAPSFYKWTGLVGADFTKPLSYDRSNSLTFNYSKNYTSDNVTVPGYWRGIYRWILDTDRPNLCPWEMLGFSVKPSWWVEVYGEPLPSSGGYTSNNLLMWRDLANGIVREPNVPPVKLPKYQRPILLSHLPVDENGNLISPLAAGMVSGPITQSTNNNFVFGDVSPVEAAWRRSSHYPYSVLIASLLMTPAKTFGLALDRSRIVRNLAGQLIYKDSGLRIKPSDIVLPSIQSSTERVQTAGIVNFIVDYIMNYVFSNNVSSYNKYISNLASLTPQLSYRVGAFTNKDQFKLLLESKTPESSGNVFVPAEDYSLFLNKSSPLKKLTYSGVIITKLSTGFEIKGYSNSQPYFNYYDYLLSGTTVNVGGISAAFTTWTDGKLYNAGAIVKYGDDYYTVKTTHTANVFDTALYARLSSLPIVGGATAQLRNAWDKTETLSLPYGTTLATAQEVVDFMMGYSAWLSDAGFVFDEFNQTLGTICNWETSAKEFLFWTTQNWSTGEDKWEDWVPNQAVTYGSIVRYNGEYYSANYNIPAEAIFDEDQYNKLDGLSNIGSSVISLSPAANAVTFNTELVVVDAINNPFNPYEIFKVDGTPIPVADLNSYREGNTVTYTPTAGDGIYGASFFLLQNEHVVVINNSTIFNDTIYNPTSGYRQERMKLSGYVTENWYGGLDIPGFVFDQATINSWQQWKDYTAGDIVSQQGFYYSANEFIPGAASFDATEWTIMDDKPTAKVLPNWTNLATQFTDFYSLESDSFNVAQQTMAQHLIGYQKRQYLSNIIQDDVSEFKFFQGMVREKGTPNVLNKLFNALGADSTDSLTFYEEWALRVGQYGATDSFENIEFVLDEGKFKNNPQAFLLTDKVSSTLSSFVIQQTPNDVYLKPAGYSSNPFPSLAAYKPFLRSAGFVNESDAALAIASLSDMVNQDITAVNYGDYIWCSFENKPITLLDSTNELRLWDIYKYTPSSLVASDIVYDSDVLSITFDSEISLSVGDIIGLTGFTAFTGFYQIASVVDSTITIDTTVVGFPAPLTNPEDLAVGIFVSSRGASIETVELSDNLVTGEMVWTGSEVDGDWKVWEYTPTFATTELVNSDTRPEYQYNTVIAINNDTTLSATANFTGEIITREKAGVTLPWTVRQTIQTPFVANLVIGNDPNTTEDRISAALAFSSNGTWLASGMPLANDVATGPLGDYYPVTPDGTGSGLTAQGMITLYLKDINNVYTIVDSIVSENATDNENFGAALAFAGNTLFIGATGSNTVYTMEYKSTEHATASYNPVGSSGSTIVVSTTAGIEVGMEVVGAGFNGQTVAEVINGTTLLLSGSPISTPSDLLTFITTGWKYGDQSFINADSGYGSKITVSADNSTVLISSDTTVYVYKLDNGVYVDTGIEFDGATTAVSNTGEFIAISDLSTIIVYQYTGTEYSEYQELFPRTTSDFGTRLSFMNDYKSLIIYSTVADAGKVEVYDYYISKWSYSETAIETEIDGEYSMVVGLNQIIVTDVGNTLYAVSKTTNNFAWSVKHSQEPIPNVSRIKKAFLYNRTLGELVTYLDVIDPAQGKIPGIADEEIKFKTFYDPATYTVANGVDANKNADNYWSKSQVGMLWWDLRATKFVNSYFDNVVYKNSMWNTLAVGASVDIYEWVETSLLPSEWDELADTPAGIAEGISGTSLYGDSAYSARQRYDNISKTFTETYYYWVKNKNLVPNISGRKLSALTISNLIANPRGQGYAYLALTGMDSFSLVNVQQYLSDSDVVLSIEYWLTDKTDQSIHSQWKLISNDPVVSIPKHIEQKWFDSLSGVDAAGRTVPDMNQPPKLRYGIENRPRQSMFVNRIEALKEFIERVNNVLINTQVVENYDMSSLDQYDVQPSLISGLYDITIDTDAELRFTNASSFIRPVLSPVVSDNGTITGIDIIFAGRGYVSAPPIMIAGNGINAEVKAIINTSGQVIGATVLNGGEGYSQASTMCSVRDFSVLVNSDSQAGNSWGIYSYDTTNSLWSRVLTQSYDVRKYWSYQPWYATGYNQFTAPDYVVGTFVELSSLSVNIGELVKVSTANTGGWMILEKYTNSTSVDWTESYTLVGMENGTIQLSQALYDFTDTTVGYDAGTYDSDVYDLVAITELRIILDTLRDKIFVGALKQAYLDLFLASVRYAHSEQVYLDWAFKTSFVRATHHLGELGQPVTYPVDNLANFEDYVAEVKPYRTHIREYISSYNKVDYAQSSVTDFDLQPVYNNGKVSLINAYVANDQLIIDDATVQTYPWKHWLDNVGFVITDLVIIDGGSGYIGQPTVQIISDSGSGAVAKAYIANGRVNRVILVTPGSKYLSAPTINLQGGLSDSGTAARVVAHIGDGVTRSNLISLKFDRLTQTYYITDLNVTESIPTIKGRLQYPLTWAPDVRIGKASVTVDGTPVLRDTYSLRIVKSSTAGYAQYTGSVTFETAPAEDSTIVVQYMKDVSLLNAADRIKHYYGSDTNELGGDLSQLMSGIDYGGVQVNGLGFEVTSGWDKRPYGSESWDVYDQTFNDYVVQVAANTHTFTLPYTPAEDDEINIYHFVKSVTSTATDGQTVRYDYDPGAKYPTATVSTVLTTDGTNAEGQNTLVLTDATVVSVGDIVTVGELVSGSVISTTVTSNLVGLSSVSGLSVGDKIRVTGTTFGGLAESLYYIASIVGSAVTLTTRVGGSAVQVSTATGNMAFIQLNPFGFETKVVSIVGDTLTLNQILFGRVLTGSSVTVTRALVQPTDISIYPNGYAVLTSALPTGSTLNIIGMVEPVRIEQSTITNVGSVYNIPNTIQVNEGDKFILRQSTSDGSIASQDLDYDTAISGGDLAYSTAEGISPDIIIDGDGFVTPTSSPAPEEVVPGQVVDAVAIKVFDNPNAGSAKIKVDNYVADGKTRYKIGQRPNSPEAVIVKIDSTVMDYGTDYSVDYNNNEIVFAVAPTTGTSVSIFSIGFSGANILDLDYFVGDGTTTEFITKAPWIDEFSSLVYQNGTPVVPEAFATDSSYELPGLIGLRFTSAPADGDLINFIIVSGTAKTFAVTSTETIAADGRDPSVYALSSMIGNARPNESNMIVRVGQDVLQAPNNSYFTIGSNRLTYTIDPNKFPPNSVDISSIVVYAGGNLLNYGSDYTVNLGGLSVKINRSIYNQYTGGQLIVSISQGQGYSYNSFLGEITFTQVYDNTNIEIVSSFIHDVLDVQRTTINVTTELSVTPDTTEYYYFKSIAGGKILLDRPVIDDNYVWVNVNGKLLTPSIDYKLLDDHMTVLLAKTPASNDAIELVTFGSNILPSTGIAYMQFKDMLNRVHFKRLNANKQTRLLRDLRYNDREIEVEDASNFEVPSPAQNRPGIIEVRGERIEYFAINGNILSKLRRGTLGTGTPTIHRSGTYVQDIGSSETIPYNDTTISEQVLSTGSDIINLRQIHTGITSADVYKGQPLSDVDAAALSKHAVEVFVGGYDDATNWASGVAYAEGKIVRLGGYTYKCITAHTSSSAFATDSANWTFFIGNIRLKKNAYQVFNVNVAPYSPAGDVEFEPDFTVNSDLSQITLTNTLSVGTQVTVVKRTGIAWDSVINIQDDDSKIARFLKAQPGTWYTDVRPSNVGTATFDSTRVTFDNDTIIIYEGN